MKLLLFAFISLFLLTQVAQADNGMVSIKSTHLCSETA